MFKRVVLILLLALVPIQMTWAAVNVYCADHVESTAAQHAEYHNDHNEHEYTDTDHDDSGESDSQKTTEQAQGHHHHGGTVGLLSSVSLPTHKTSSSDMHTKLQARISSPPPSQPERPNWYPAI